MSVGTGVTLSKQRKEGRAGHTGSHSQALGSDGKLKRCTPYTQQVTMPSHPSQALLSVFCLFLPLSPSLVRRRYPFLGATARGATFTPLPERFFFLLQRTRYLSCVTTCYTHAAHIFSPPSRCTTVLSTSPWSTSLAGNHTPLDVSVATTKSFACVKTEGRH